LAGKPDYRVKMQSSLYSFQRAGKLNKIYVNP
jgi:hypothetical protein